MYICGLKIKLVRHLYNFLERIVEWRNKHIKQRPFIMLLSILIGITSGLVAATIKKSVHYTEYFLTNFFSPYTPNYLYFLYPMLGIGITVLIAKYVIRNGKIQMLISRQFKSLLMIKRELIHQTQRQHHILPRSRNSLQVNPTSHLTSLSLWHGIQIMQI